MIIYSKVGQSKMSLKSRDLIFVKRVQIPNVQYNLLKENFDVTDVVKAYKNNREEKTHYFGAEKTSNEVEMT